MRPTDEACAIILARGGSKGIPGKNLRPVGGLSLLARSVLAARESRRVGRIFVSTDEPVIAEEAVRFGAIVIHRPAELANDTASSESGWLHALAEIERDGGMPARLVFLQCTSPFTTGSDIDGCLAAMEEQAAACALSVLEDHGFHWRRDAAGLGTGVNHDHTAQRARRQDRPPTFRESGAIYCVRTEAFRRIGLRFCGPVALYPIDHPAVEIDSPADLALCDLIARGRPVAPNPERLAAVCAVVMDFDGVHTDDTVVVDERGVESVSVSRSDGLGLGRLREAGRHRLLVLSKERNPVVGRRAAKLRIPVKQGIDDKHAALAEWLTAEDLTWASVLYVGNDVNDLPPLRAAGLSACPLDAHPEVLAMADWVLPAPGGRGALRHLADALLRPAARP